MGIDYSNSVGYGIAIPDNEAGKYLKTLEPYEDGQIPEIMETCGWDLVGYDYCGDWMGGPQVYFFYIKGTEILNEQVGFGDTITEFGDTPIISLDALRQLNDLAEHFGITDCVIGWKLISNVS